MKKRLYLEMARLLKGSLGLLSVLALGALSMQAQVTVQVGTGTVGQANTPINTNWGYNYTQQIYKASEISAAGGYSGTTITKIRFYFTAAASPVNNDGWTVYMANSARNTFNSVTDWEPIASFTQVFSGTVVFPGTAGWVEVPLSTPFAWNGTSNIIVAVDENTPNFTSSYNWNATATGTDNRSIFYRNDSNNPDPASPPAATNRATNIANIQFDFAQSPCTGTPAPGNTISSVASLCAGATPTINFSLQNNYLPNSGITYQWQSFDGTNWNDITGATGVTYSIVGLAATTQFRCKVTCGGTDQGISNPVTVTVNPLPAVSVAPVTAVSCASEAITLTASGADTYAWSPNTNLSATTGQTVNSTAASSVTYTVVGTTTATGCTNSATATVSPIASLPISISSSPSPVCAQGSPVTLTATPPAFVASGATVEYQWLDSAGTTVLQDWGTGGYTFTPANIGTYTFNVKARVSSCPATVSATQAYSINVGFNADVTVNDIYCGQTAGSIVVTNPFGPLATGVWYENNFATSNLVPAQAQLYGTGSSIAGGRLILTPNTGSLNGAIQVFNPNGINPNTLQLDFDLTVGGGPTNSNGADGLSWSFGPDVVPIPTATNAENGSGTGLKIGFDAYGSSGGGVAGIYLMYNSTVMDQTTTGPGVLQYVNNLSWKGSTNHITITITAQGKLTMKIGANTIFNNVQLPAAYLNANKSTWKHVFSARTGGVSEAHEIDNLKIQYTAAGVQYGITPGGAGTPPATWQAANTFSGLALGSYDVYIGSPSSPTCYKLLGTYTLNDGQTPAPGNTLSSLPSVCANTTTSVTLSLQNSYAAYTGITWQWQSFDGTNWNNIAGATSATYTFTGLAQTTQFRCNVTCDGSLTGASTPVTVSSVTPPTVSVTPAAVTLCSGETATLTATGADTYTWSPNTGLSGTTGSSVTAAPTAYQSYVITGTETATGCSNTANVYVTPIEFLPVTTSISPASVCTTGVPVTLDVTSIPDYVAGFGTMEFQWLDSTGVIVQDWSATSAYTFTPTVEGYHEYQVNVRSTACGAVPPTKTVGFYVGFGGEVTTVDINCYIPTGTINILNPFGQGVGGIWYANNFATATLTAAEATLHQNASIAGGRAVLTPSATSNRGGLTILNPAGIVGTNVQYDISFRMTADTPINVFGTGGGDGIGYSFGPDANYVAAGAASAGFGSKLRISFDAADNSSDNGNARGIYVTYGYNGTLQMGPAQSTTLAYSPNISLWKLQTDIPVAIRISMDGKLTLTVNDTVVFNDIQLPAEFQNTDKTTWKHVFSAHTGGDALRQAIDDLNIRYTALNFGLAAGGSGVLPTDWQNSTVFDSLAAGDYDVYISNVDDSTCNKFLGTYSILDLNPHVDFPADTVLCAGESFVLDAGNPGSFYEWSTGEVGTDERYKTVTGPGTYIVEVTDTIGCEAFGLITVTGGVIPQVELGSDTSICSGNTLTLDAGTDGTTYLWTGGSSDQTLDVTATGNYSVTVTNADGCSNDDAVTVTVLNAPTVAGVTSTVNGGSVTFTATTPQNATTYQWNFGDGNTITALSPSIQYNYAECGEYTATLTVGNANGCGTDDAQTSFEIICSGIEEADIAANVGVYPNPASEYIQLANPNGLTIEGIAVFDAAGKQLYQTAGNQTAMPDITAWAPGMYLIKIQADGKTFTQRFIISR